MSFHYWDGLTEIRTFTDLYHWVQTHREKILCPECGRQMVVRMMPSFNMEQFGQAQFYCTSLGCPFRKEPIRIEAIGGKPHGLEAFRRKKYPGDN